MYEQFKNQFISALSENFTMEELQIIGTCMDVVAHDYDISKKETRLVVYNQELPEMVKIYLVCKKMEGLSDATLYNYRIHLHNFFLSIQKAPEQVTANDIRVFLYKYQVARKISNRTLDKYREIIAGFFEWAYNEDYLVKNIVKGMKAIKYEKKPRKALTQIELEYLRKACVTSKERAIIEFLYSTGCRVSELADLKKCDVSFDTKMVHLFGKGKKHRTSFLNAKCVVTLREYLNSREDTNEYLFVSDRRPHNRMHKAGIEKIVKIISQRAYENTGKHVTPHVLRHTTATTALQNGMPVEDISKLLGHAQISTTMIYAETSMENVQAEHKKYVI